MILVLPDDTEIVYHGEPIIIFPQDSQCNTFSFAQEEAICITETYTEPYYIQTQKDYDYIENNREKYDEDNDFE